MEYLTLIIRPNFCNLALKFQPMDAKWYAKKYAEKLKEVHAEKWAHRRAFELTEAELKQEYGLSRYKNFDSFDAARRRAYHKKSKPVRNRFKRHD